MDILGQILWFLIFATPFLTVPLIWKLSKQKKVIGLILGLILAFLISLLLYFISLVIVFRDGIGS